MHAQVRGNNQGVPSPPSPFRPHPEEPSSAGRPQRRQAVDGRTGGGEAEAAAEVGKGAPPRDGRTSCWPASPGCDRLAEGSRRGDTSGHQPAPTTAPTPPASGHRTAFLGYIVLLHAPETPTIKAT
ncbi:Protein of unknown function [Gryllus bimaculatus]|nr:Protein of unknown function [Gryllus bimaculatus]